MKISVITVCKNASSTIEIALESLYNQTYKNIEHIVVDGVSTDSTLDILSKYQDKISVLVSEPDSGIYNAMNKAVKMATGDVVYFLNATDLLYDNLVLEKVANEFLAHPDLELLWGDIQFVEKNENIRIATFENIKTKADLMYHNPCHQSIFYKRELFDKFGYYDETLPIYADYEYNVRLLVLKDVRCKYLPYVFAKFELGGVSTTTDEKVKVRQKKERKEIYKKHFSANFYYKMDNFFMKIFGTQTKFLKKTKFANKMFNSINNLLLHNFNKQFRLNMISG